MLFGMLEEAARRGSSRRALATGKSQITYGQLTDRARGLARELHGRGAGSGSRIFLNTDDPILFAIGFFAVQSLGSVVVTGRWHGRNGLPTGTVLAEQQADFVLAPRGTRSSTVLRIHSPDLPRVVADRNSAAGKQAGFRMRQVGPAVAERNDTEAVVCSRHQANLVHEAKELVRSLGLRPDDHVVCTLPIGQSPGLSVGLLASVCAQASLAACGSADPAAIGDALVSGRPSVLVTDCSTLAGQRADLIPSTDKPGGVRFILMPQSPLVPEIIGGRGLNASRIVTFYSRIDTGVIALNERGGGGDCAGRPLPGVRVFLVKGWDVKQQEPTPSWNFGSFVCLRSFPTIFLDESRQVNEPGQSGRIVVASPAAAPGAARDGCCYTQDHGYFDSEGCLHLLPNSGQTAIARLRCA